MLASTGSVNGTIRGLFMNQLQKKVNDPNSQVSDVSLAANSPTS